tara:strand:+ start:1788 stop:2603 length:816 start_codon:yes stop_codon:yes gene_type:complete
MLKINVVYILWANKKDTAITVASETAISIMSIRRSMPDANIIVYVTKKTFKFFIPFLKKFANHILDTVTESRYSLVCKIMTFQRLIDKKIKTFIYFDSDTIIKRDFTKVLPDVDIRFSGFKGGRAYKMTRAEFKFFKKRYKIKNRIPRVCSCVIYVNKLHPPFWNKFKSKLEYVLDVYKDKIEKYKVYQGGLHPRFNDEHYFSMTLFKAGIRPSNVLFNVDIFNSRESKYILHKKNACLKKDDTLMLYCLKEAKEAKIDMSFFNYPRIIPD